MEEISVYLRSGRLFTTLQLPINGDFSGLQLKRMFHDQFLQFPPSRQRWNVGSSATMVKDEDKLCDFPHFLEEKSVIFKDLGPQLHPKKVYLTEYVCPLIIYFLFLFPFVRRFAYTNPSYELNFMQNTAAVAWVIHFGKRIGETEYVHHWASDATLPRVALIKNSAYYSFFAFFISYPVNYPDIIGPSPPRVIFGMLLFMIFEGCNFYCHWILSQLRRSGTRERGIPRGFLFEYASCPHYACEVMSWISFFIITDKLTVVIFAIVGGWQMYQWAGKKHGKYHSMFSNYPQNRKIMFPLIL